MRIGIDIRDMAFCRVGVGNVTHEMLSYFSQKGHEHTYILYQYADKDYMQGVSVRKRLVPIPPYALYKEQLYFSAHSLFDQLDIFHAPIHIPPYVVPRKTKIVFTVHDIHSELDAQYFPPDMNAYFIRHRFQAIKRADAVIVHTQFVKEKILQQTGISEEKVIVLPLGVAEHFCGTYTNEAASAIKKKYQLPDRFLLYVGSVEPWKQVPYVIDEFVSFSAKHPEMHLVIVGREGWNQKENAHVRRKIEQSACIQWLGYVDHADLPVLYKNAWAFCSASLWEGFGLIFLEAMAAGCPVFAPQRAAVPEVVGDAAVLFDPTRTNALSEAWASVYKNSSHYELLKKKGIARAQLYTWDAYGAGVLRLYERL